MNPQYKQQPYRFFNAFLFCLTAVGNSLIVQSFSPISKQISEYCRVSEAEVNLCALVFMIVHPFMSFVANYLLNKWGIKFGCTVNSVMVIMGLLLRLLVKSSFTFVLLGSILIAFGNVFVLNSPSQFSANWFRPEKRLVVTSLAVFSSIVSGGVGAVFSPFIVRPGLSPQEGLQSVFKLLSIQAILAGTIMLLNILLFRGNPINPPAPSAEKKRENFKQAMILLFTNRNYVLSFLSMMFMFGCTNSFAVTIEPFLIPFGITSKQAGFGLSLTVLTGLTGAVVSSILIKRTKNYKRIIMFQYILGIACMIMLVLPLYEHIMWLFWIGICLLGLFIYPIIPGIIELGCELVFPVGEAMSTGFILSGGQLFGFLLGLGQSYVITGNSRKSSLVGGAIYTLTFVIGMGFFVLVKEDLRRKKYEEDRQANKDSLMSDINR